MPDKNKDFTDNLWREKQKESRVKRWVNRFEVKSNKMVKNREVKTK